MARPVRDDGSTHARIVVIGEAPGAQEVAQGRPFVGPSGQMLLGWLRDVGLSRTDIYWTNVYPFQPPANKIEAVPRHELDAWVEQLHTRLGDLTDPWVLVPTGNTALQALTGKRRILKHRGSIYEYHDTRDRRIKVIPTIHPAAVFRTPGWERRCRADWRRIAGDVEFRELRLPMREHFTHPTLSDLQDFLAQAQTASTLALDIETPSGDVDCLAISIDPSFSLTIPTVGWYWHGDLDPVWKLIRALCELPIPKVTQNGHYDTFHLAQHDIRLRRWQWDTLAMHHCLDALDAHDLAYMASIDTRQPYWKDEAKDPEEAAKYASNLDALWTYNGIDAAVTNELAQVYSERLHARGLHPFYDRHYRRLFLPLLSLMLRGVRLDERRRRQRYTRLTAHLIAAQDHLTALAGEPLYAKKDLSAKRLARFLYETLRLPKAIDRKTGKVTTKEVAVRRLMLRFPEKLTEAGTLILDHRRKKKMAEFLDEGKLDTDGRMRCTYKFTTETGRLASSKSPRGTGRNLQNIDREVRDVFIPDEGTIFLEVDLSQAEGRVTYVYTHDPMLIAVARRSPAEYDMHRDNATIIFGIAENAVTKDQRYLAKRGVHASHYGLGGKKLSDMLLTDGYVHDEDECQAMIGKYMNHRPAIRTWQASIRKEILQKRVLSNSWGRMIDFTYERLSDDLFRRGYAFKPQSDVGALMNQWGLVPLTAFLRASRMRSTINLHVHDSLVLCAVPEEAYDLAQFAKESLERPRMYEGVNLTIPLEYRVGRTWMGDKDWKSLPDRDEFESAIRELIRHGQTR